jgi:hypothetical protein
MSFPLYDILLKDCTNTELSIEQKRELINIIPTLDDKAHQNIFTIIRIYGLKNSSSDIFEIPYEGNKINNDVKFNLDKLPNVLGQMIYRFITIHNQKMKEEKQER